MENLYRPAINLREMTVVVADAADPVLADLAWDLGATVVLFPPQPRHYLVEILGRLLEPPIHDHPVSQLPETDC